MIRDRRAILALLTALNFLNYIDRYVVAAVLPSIMDEMKLSNTEAGLFASAFLIGYFATAPLFGARADKGARRGLLTLGIVVWSLGTAASGLATGFWTMVAARIIVGVGESSFAAIAPTIIDDVMPPEKRGSALTVFYLALPMGSALGYVLGGLFAARWNWHVAFFLTGGPGVVLALSCLFIAEPARVLADARARLVDGLRELTKLPLFRRSVMGYAAYAAATGAFSYWAPKFLIKQFPTQLTEKSANFWFGAITCAAGFLGTWLGGWLMQRKVNRLSAPADAAFDAPENKAQVNAMLWVCAAGMAIAAPLAALVFFLPVSGFFAVGFVAEVGLFMSTSPVAAAALRSVPPERRASAMAATIFAIHLFGDLWSPALLGVLQDYLPAVIAMMGVPVTVALAAYLWWPRAREASGLPEARARSVI